MSFTDRLVISLHVAFVVFSIGPVSIAILASPRYIRQRNVPVLRYLLRTTRIFGTASLGVLVFGIVAAQQLKKLSASWITAAMTLFVVSLVLLVIIMRDQRRAVVALETAAAPAVTRPASEAVGAGTDPAAAAAAQSGAAQSGAAQPAAPEPTAADVEPPPAAARTAAAAGHVATVERGRIASMAGVVSLIWLVILVLMVWNS